MEKEEGGREKNKGKRERNERKKEREEEIGKELSILPITSKNRILTTSRLRLTIRHEFMVNLNPKKKAVNANPTNELSILT
eukprot:1368225-Amorphochlora_amoeboformis.AAC.1